MIGAGMTGRSGLLRALTAGTPGLDRVRRPADENGPAFNLSYVRSGPRTGAPPVVVVPGGPGLGSVLPYRSFRRRAASLGHDVIMIEHRGVGLSRVDHSGRDLPMSAMWIRAVVEDIAAVLDRESVASALVVGSSYGSYLASCFGALYPDRVAGMLLDSALQSAQDIDLERRTVRSVLWEADTEVAQHICQLHSEGVNERILLDITRAAYELGGPELLTPLLRSQVDRRGGLAWRAIQAYGARDESMPSFPGVYEFSLAGAIGFRELGYGGQTDGLPLDPALTYAPLASRFPPFEAEPVDLHRAAAGFTWPLVLLSGTRDLRTPPAIAERVAAVVPDAAFVRIENGHSALESHPEALLAAVRALADGDQEYLPQRAEELSRLPRRGLVARSPDLIAAVVRASRSGR